MNGLQSVLDNVRPAFEYQIQYVNDYLTGKGIDMGCGACPLMVPSCVLWVDISPQPIALEQIPEDKFLQTNSTALKGNQDMDYVFSSHMVEDLATKQDMIICLQNWGTFIKPGGCLVILIPDMENRRYPRVEEGGNPSHRINVGRKIFEEIEYDLNGFKIVQIDTIPHEKSCTLDIVFKKDYK